MSEAATTTIVNAAFSSLDASPVLAGRGSKERAHPWNADDLPRWKVEWEGETGTGAGGRTYQCELDLVFTANAEGEGANARVDAMRFAAQTALEDSVRLDDLVEDIRFADASRELDDLGRARTGTIRVRFRGMYQADRYGSLEER